MWPQVNPGILPNSAGKIEHAKDLFSQYIDANIIASQVLQGGYCRQGTALEQRVASARACYLKESCLLAEGLSAPKPRTARLQRPRLLPGRAALCCSAAHQPRPAPASHSAPARRTRLPNTARPHLPPPPPRRPQMALPKTGKLTPKRFINNIHEICRSQLQNIVLPEVGGRGGAGKVPVCVCAWNNGSGRGVKRVQQIGAS